MEIWRVQFICWTVTLSWAAPGSCFSCHCSLLTSCCQQLVVTHWVCWANCFFPFNWNDLQLSFCFFYQQILWFCPLSFFLSNSVFLLNDWWHCQIKCVCHYYVCHNCFLERRIYRKAALSDTSQMFFIKIALYASFSMRCEVCFVLKTCTIRLITVQQTWQKRYRLLMDWAETWSRKRKRDYTSEEKRHPET